jgi:hypothetical protein
MTLTFRPTIKEIPKPLRLRITLWGAVVYAAATAIGTLYVLGQLLLSTTINVQLPVETFWPELTKSVKLDPVPVAKVVSGGFTQANVMMSGVGVDAKLWLAAGHLLEGATYLAISVAIAILCSRLLKGDPFGPILTRTITRAGAAILIGGLGWQVCYSVGGWKASIAALQITGSEMSTKFVDNLHPDNLGWPHPGGNVEVGFWPIWIALALFAIAAIFRYGEKLQRDNAALKRDTTGLV